MLSENFQRPASFSIDELFADGKPFAGTSRATLVVRYSPRIARWIAEREGKEVVDDGSLTIEHPLADERWAVRHLLQYGPDAEVLSPESVRVEVKRTLLEIVGRLV
jgi:proteasome accessory factor C